MSKTLLCTCHETAINGDVSCPVHNRIDELEADLLEWHKVNLITNFAMDKAGSCIELLEAENKALKDQLERIRNQ